MTDLKHLMDQPTATKLQATIAVACAVLIVVGLSLVSNRLLDLAGIANERGLSVEERKDKARRNQDEWNQGKSSKGSGWVFGGANGAPKDE